MASFYGNMKNNSRASFIFDRVYPSRVAMETMLHRKNDENVSIGDGIFINRYVLVDYHYALSDDITDQEKIDEYYIEVENGVVNAQNISAFYTRTIETTEGGSDKISYKQATTFTSNGTKYYQRKVFVDRFRPDTQEITDSDLQNSTSELLENELYYAHRYADWEKYHASYDCTVWMKIYADNEERYIMVAELDAKAPILEFVDDAPSCVNGSGHFDVRASTDLNYKYYIPKNWNIVLNNYNPNNPIEYTEEDNEHWYYQSEKDSNDLWYENYVLTQDEQVVTGKNYFNIIFIEADIPVGQYIQNLHCYTKTEEDKYILTNDIFALEDVQYYIIESIEKVQNLKIDDNINGYGYYELNNTKKTFNDQVEYPYFNIAGFDQRISTHVDTRGSGIFVNKVPSINKYPVHKFTHAGVLTKDTWLPNRYFTYNGIKVEYTGNTYDRDHAYYIGPSTITEDSVYELVPLIVNKQGQFQLAKQPDSNQACYYDEDLTNIDNFTKATEWNKNVAYYEITTELNEDGTPKVDHEDDTYRLDVYLPEFGNTVADIYDILYGAPKVNENKTDGYNNLIGYCSQDQFITYNLIGWCTQEMKDSYILDPNGEYGTANDYHFDLSSEQLDALSVEKDEDNGYTIPVYLMDGNGDYWAGNRKFNLTDEQFYELSPEYYPGIYDIPVYLKEGSNVRPYDLDRLKSTLAPPYDNLTDQDDISLGWSLTLLKRYLSELRYLANGKTGDEEHGIGLQSDWILDDKESFGYIHHRPNLITTYTVTSDTLAVPNKTYYKETIANGEIVYEPLSSHYKRLTQENYVSGEDLPNLLQDNLYYQNKRNIYKSIEQTDTQLIDSTNNNRIRYEDIKKIIVIPNENVNNSNYQSYYIMDNTYGRAYIQPNIYLNNINYFDFQSLNASDCQNAGWYYQGSDTYIYEINENNYIDAQEKTIYVQDDTLQEGQYITFNNTPTHKYRLFNPNIDLIKDPNIDSIIYYCDFDDNENTAPDQITQDNIDNIDGHPIWYYSNNQYHEFHYEGFYYSKEVEIYNEISEIDYNKDIYKYNNNTNQYEIIGLADLSNYYYYLENQEIYVKITENNYIYNKQKYINDNGEYKPLTLQYFASGDKYYIYTPETVDYQQITQENWDSFNPNSDIYLYKESEINFSDSLPTAYTVYELPRTYTNDVTNNKSEYIRCNDPNQYDPTTQYYMWDGKQYVSARYVDYSYYIDTDDISDNNAIKGNVSYAYEYTITVDENHTITKRSYTCRAGTSQDSVTLYHNNEQENNTWLKESVEYFAICISSSGNGVDAPNIESQLIDINSLNNNDPINQLGRRDVIELLNNTLVNDYDATYEIISTHQNWPTEETDEGDIGFYYARQKVDYSTSELDEMHFREDPSQYYTLQLVPVEQDDYEIHNIWNSVLQKGIRES